MNNNLRLIALTKLAQSPAGGQNDYITRANAAVKDVIPFIKKHEKFVPKAYRKQLGVKVGKPVWDKWTLGYGQTTINGRDVREGDTITEPEAAKFVAQRVRENAAKLYKQNPWTQHLSQGALSALYDTAYNAGPAVFSTTKSPNLNYEMNSADMDWDSILKRELPTYASAGGVRLKGLVNRRNDAIQKWF